MIKKIAIVIVINFITIATKAQLIKPFEGEIVYETYENYSDYLKSMCNSIYFDGVHKIRVILKGAKVHVIDETTKCHTIANADIIDLVNNGSKNNEQGGFVHFCELTKTGLDFTKNTVYQTVLSASDLHYADGSVAKTSIYSFAKNNTGKEIMGEKCFLYQGSINHMIGSSTEQKYDVKAYVSDIIVPKGYNLSLYGLQIPGIAMKWIIKYDGGHVNVLNIGELSFYIEADVVEVKPRSVSDDEFIIPSDYKIYRGSSNPFTLIKYYKGIKKQLEKLGVKGGDRSQKTSGVHFKTNGEWDF